MSYIRSLKVQISPYYTVITNFGYLTILQILNLSLPLITYPYLIRVLGTEVYGMVVYSQAIVSYLVVLVNFGFNITATKEISINKHNKAKVSEIASNIYIIKGSLFFISFLIMYIFLLSSNQTVNYRNLFYLTLWMCLYEFIFPLWYFQGVEKMKYITFITLLSRISFLVLIFLFIRSANDYLWVPLVNGFGAIISGIVSIMILRKDGVKFSWQPLSLLLEYIRKSYVMAISYGMNTFKMNFNIIIIKHIFSLTEVAYFDLAMKIMNLGVTFLDLISQAVFPRMSRLKDINFLKKIIIVSVFTSIVMMLMMQIFSSNIVQTLGGNNMEYASNLTQILAINLPIYIIGALLGRNCLLIYGYDRFVLKSMVYSGLFYLLMVISYSTLGPKPQLTAFVYAYLLSFLFETLYRYKICVSKNLL